METNLTRGNVTGVLVRFALPLFAANLLQSLYSLVDMAVMGRFLGSPGLAALGSSATICYVITSVCAGVTTGGSVLVAQYLGREDRAALRETVGSLFSLSLAVSAAVTALVKETMDLHSRIIFNGDGYAGAWPQEAARRGLLNLSSTAEALPHFRDRKNLDLLTRHNIFSEAEIVSRCDIMLETYCKTIHIEALTMRDMARREILPACLSFERTVADGALAKKQLGLAGGAETRLLTQVSALNDALERAVSTLEEAVEAAPKADAETLAHYYHDEVIPCMDAVRKPADALERMVGKEYWPFPTYADLLFEV